MSIIDDFDFGNKKDFNYGIFIIVIGAILLAVYFGNICFGNKSISRLLDLKAQREILQKEVKKLEQDNSKKQKQYFELKQLEGNK